MLCKHYIESARDAPSDLRAILIETTAVKAILENIEFLSQCEVGESPMLDCLFGTSGPVKGCHDAIRGLQDLLQSNKGGTQISGPSRPKTQRIEVILTSLAWPLKATKAKKLLEEIARHKNTITFTLTADSIHDIKKIREHTTQIQQILTASQRSDVHNWLKDIDPSSIHHQTCKNHEVGTCDWMLRHPEWAKFKDGGIRCLWIHGIPGAGKTVLASQLIKNIEKHCRTSASTHLRSVSVHYYCYFGHNRDESIPLLKWLLDRLCRKADFIPERLWRLYQHGNEPSPDDLLEALEASLDHFDNVCVTIDAIDESNPRHELLKLIQYLASDPRFTKVRLLVTSREYLDIEEAMQSISIEVSMQNPYLDGDIRLYVQSRINSHDKIKNWPQDLRDGALEALSDGAKG
ncbi:ankyrin repeat protein, partial [Colletotrichum incanum]